MTPVLATGLTVLGSGALVFVVSLGATTLMSAKSQQRKDWQRYRIRTPYWCVVLEILGLRKVQ